MHHNIIIKDGDSTKVKNKILVDGVQFVDEKPVKGSSNMVTSGGVYNAINGAGGAKEIVYFDIDPSDPPSGLYDSIAVTLSNDKEPVIRIDDAVYFYTATGTDKYVFVGGYKNEAVGYTEIEVSDDDSVTSKSVDDKVFNMYLLYKTDPASPGDPPGTEDYWVCDADKHIITKDELLAAHADCRYFILNNDVEPDSNSRKYFASVTDITDISVRLQFYMMTESAVNAADFFQKIVTCDSEGRLYVLSSYSANLIGMNQASLGYVALPTGGLEEEPAWAKVCELDLGTPNGYNTCGLALLFTSDRNNQDGGAVESGLFVVDISSYPTSPANSCNASWMAYTHDDDEYSKILGIKLIGKYGVPSDPHMRPYPLYKIEVWVKYYGNNHILVNALQNTRYDYIDGVFQGIWHFPENHIATLQLTEPSYSDTEEYIYKNFFYPAESPSVTDLKSFMITPRSDWLAFDGTNNLVFGSVFSTASEEVAGDKIRMIIRDGETKYCIEGAKLGVYKLVGTINVKWTGTPVNRIGSIYGYEIDFSKNFDIKRLGTMPALVKITSSAQDFYKLSIPMPASVIDAPIGVQISMSFQIQYLGNVED